MKLVIEPDCIIAGLTDQNAPEHKLLRYLADESYILLVSAPLLYAYEQALYDHRQSINLKFREIEEALSYIASRSEYVPCHPLWHSVMNKPEKDLTMACAYIGKADFTVVKRPDLYKEAKTTLNLDVLNAKKALKHFQPKTKKRKAA